MILQNGIPKTCSYTRMILYSLQHFKALQLHIKADLSFTVRLCRLRQAYDIWIVSL